MKLSSEDLPFAEQEIWDHLRSLPSEEKKTLWRLIQHANKDHLCLIPYITGKVLSLEHKQIITKNRSYRGKDGASYYILRSAPHLMKKLQAYADKPSPLP